MSNNEKKINEAAVVETEKQIYEASVLKRMEGRCGTSPSGAKGIAFEIMDIDQMNAKDIFTPGRNTQVTKNPRATVLDAVTMQDGKVVRRIQYKDTPTGIEKTLNQVQSGKYDTATLKGTKETAARFNELAPGKGINKTMEASSLSTKDTTRVGDKFLAVNRGTMPANVAVNLGNAAKSSAIGAAGLTAAIEVGKSVLNGDDVGTCANNVVSKTSESVVAGAAGGLVGEAAFIGAALVCPAVAVPAAIVGGIAGATVAGDLVEGAFDEVGDFAEDVVNGVKDVAEEVVDGVKDIAESISDGLSDLAFEIGWGFRSFFW